MDINTIKLIIWDLDDTLWHGTLSEEKVVLDDTIKDFIKALTDCGIICSICSKNDFEQAKAQLVEFGIWDYFVFPSINWDNKAMRIKAQIDQMALREPNVLFLDDNTFNLQEASFVMPELQVATPEVIPDLIAQVNALDKKDVAHKRLKQYKILEQKALESLHYDSNEAFLRQSQIQVRIEKDCLKEENRLHELILRTNQLNFTKKRITIEELHAILTDKHYECGYIRVSDRYGDYGIVGFYALKDNVLEHFLFSCRTMGQMIEQYVYAELGFPELQVVGEVRTQLNKTDRPTWINQSNTQQTEQVQPDLNREIRILLKGPCDLRTASNYLPKKKCTIDTEFTYTDNTGRVIDMYNHSSYIENAHRYTKEELLEQLKDCKWIDPPMLDTQFFTGGYDIIFLSSLIESAYGIYRKKDTGILVSYASMLTDKANWEYFSTRKDYNGNQYTLAELAAFTEKYEYIGFTTPEMYRSFLLNCLEWLPTTTKLCILLGATLPMNGNADTIKRHAALNKVVKELAAENERLLFIDVDEFVQSPADVTDTINHYQTRVYYKIGEAMTAIIQQCANVEMKVSRWAYRKQQLKVFLKPLAGWLKKHLPTLYKKIRK